MNDMRPWFELQVHKVNDLLDKIYEAQCEQAKDGEVATVVRRDPITERYEVVPDDPAGEALTYWLGTLSDDGLCGVQGFPPETAREALRRKRDQGPVTYSERDDVLHGTIFDAWTGS